VPSFYIVNNHLAHYYYRHFGFQEVFTRRMGAVVFYLQLILIPVLLAAFIARRLYLRWYNHPQENHKQITRAFYNPIIRVMETYADVLEKRGESIENDDSLDNVPESNDLIPASREVINAYKPIWKKFYKEEGTAGPREQDIMANLLDSGKTPGTLSDTGKTPDNLGGKEEGTDIPPRKEE